MAGGRLRPGELGSERPAAGEVTLSRGTRTEAFGIAEATPEEVVPMLRTYMTEVRVTRPYFDAAPDAPDEALRLELPRHPVLRLVPHTLRGAMTSGQARL
jgi:hypothetical protein